ncbi:hypothetical protein DBR18_06920 [Pseudomonas sp. HMWF021]|nr:hypothetical protein DBR18_06920 [Pseudomonas sp. HMWF021]
MNTNFANIQETCGSWLASDEAGSGAAYSTVAHPTPRQQIILQQCNSISLKPNKIGHLTLARLLLYLIDLPNVPRTRQ